MSSLPSTVSSAPLQRNFDFLNGRLDALDGFIFWGEGDPAGSVEADVGSLYLRTDGGAGTTLYVKESNPGTAEGWVAK